MDGKADFQTLIERAKVTSLQEIVYMSRKFPATYVVFDILQRDGTSLLDLPLIERKRLLKEYVRGGKSVVLSVYVEGEGEAYYEAAVKKRYGGDNGEEEG